MKALARLFRLLVLLALVAAALLLWRGAELPGPVPQPVPQPAPQALQGPVDRILIEKADRRLTVFQRGAAVKTYRIALGFAPQGPKRQQGDGRTPEGLYRIDRRNAASAYHLSLGIDYPRPQDVAHARAAGRHPGGDIFIHGQPNGRAGLPALRHDWTAGCIALTDTEIAELFAATAIGTEVEIRP